MEVQKVVEHMERTKSAQIFDLGASGPSRPDDRSLVGLLGLSASCLSDIS